MTRTQRDMATDRIRQTHIEVLQLVFGRGLLHKLQNGTQIANIDASLVKGLCQCGSIHRQSTVVQTVLYLVTHKTTSMTVVRTTKSPPPVTCLCGSVAVTHQ